MTLREKQSLFTYNISLLIQWAYKNGFSLTFGEAYRTKEQQEIYFKSGRSKTMNSLHLNRLAVDFNIFIDGKLINDPKLIQPLGNYWVSLNTDNLWGSDWNRNGILDDKFQDPYHFQMNP